MPDADWVKYKQIRGKPLPEVAELLGTSYRLSKVLKRDFYAAVGLYERGSASESGAPGQVLLKVYHTDPLGILPLGFVGRRLWRREVVSLKRLGGVQGVPQYLGQYGPAGLVREYIPGCNLRDFSRTDRVDADFFPRLREILAEVHGRGVSHNDLSKPENILVTPDGRPVLIDFQIATQVRTDVGPVLEWFTRRMVSHMQGVDRYHLAKLHRRRRPFDFTGEQLEALRRKGTLLQIHGGVRRPYRAVRHLVLKKFLTARDETGS